MFGNFNFRRFDNQTKESGFTYKTTSDSRELDHDFHSISMDKPGFTIHTVIKNYLAEAVMLGGSLRSSPTKITSLYHGDTRPMDEMRNHVVVTIYSSEHNHAIDPKKRTSHSRKTEIRIPGKMFNQGSVFISELDCYIMTESHMDATRELISRDGTHDGWDTVNLPDSIIKQQEPAKIYADHKDLVRYCIQRQDKINIRVGVNLDYGIIPDALRNLHVSILDHYFVPFDCYKLEYDPTLGSDEFIIENLHQAAQGVYRSTFSELTRSGVVYLDYDERDTLFGKFYGMALFSDKTHYAEYVHQRKSQERFCDETLYLAHRSGDPRLKEEIDRLGRENAELRDRGTEKDDMIGVLEDTVKRLKRDVAERESAINKIRQNHDTKMSAEAVLGELENEGRRIDNEREEIQHKSKTTKLAHRAAMFKVVGDIMKSGWGITTACLGGVLSAIAICKKYNVKITMAT